MQGKMRESVSYDDMKHPNDSKRYLRGGRMEAKHEMGETKGSKSKGNYGSRNGEDNTKYSDRGMVDPDMSRLNKQNLPNTRKYTYME